MHYHIGNMLILQEFNGGDGCPLCRIRNILEKRLVEQYLNEAVMEDSQRQAVNERGFCMHHTQMMHARQNKLSLALQYVTRLTTLKGKLEITADKKIGKKMADAMEATIKRFPEIIGAMTGMDLSVDTECFGAKVRFPENAVPAVEHAVIEKAEEVADLKVPDGRSGRVDIFLDAVVEAEKKITDRPTFGGQLGPFSLAANIMQMDKAMMAVITNKAEMHQLVEKATAFLIERAKAYKEAGANGVVMAEPAAGLLSNEDCQQFSSEFVKDIIEQVQDDHFAVILHNCGNTTLNKFTSSGFNFFVITSHNSFT